MADPKIVDDLPDTAYHADRESLSSSGARMLLPPSTPAKFRYRMDSPPEHRDVFDFGHVAHSLVLGVGSPTVIVEADSWRSKAAQQQKQDAYDAGHVPILAADYRRADALAEAVHDHPVAGILLSPGGRAETSIYWDDAETGVRLRARPDWLTDVGGRPVVVDFKTAQSAAPTEFERKAGTFGYAFQQAFYLDGVKACGLADDAAFVFIVAEKEPPYEVAVYEYDPEAVEFARKQVRQAIDLYARCVEADEWPGYTDDGIRTISLPGWMKK